MKAFGILLPFFVTICNANPRRSRNFSPDSFFEEYGYLDDSSQSTPDHPVRHSPEDRERAIRHFQKMVGLPETGVLNRRTINKMQGDRCGVKDLVPPRDRENSGGPLPFYAIGTKWDKDTVTWRFIGYTNKLSQGEQRRAISNALAKWSEVANINFREVGGGNADILIKYGTRNHGDNYPFDGQSGTLAHAFFPGGNDISGDTHFDDSEPWTVNTPEGTNLEIVAAHEFGHALGIGHSNVRGALMAPYYAGYNASYGLHRDDIQAIQSIYGARRAQPPTRRPIPTRRPPTRRPTTRRPTSGGRSYCDTKLDDVFHGLDRRIYAIRGKKIYKFNRNVNGFDSVRNTRRTLLGAPKSPGAVVQSRNQKIYMFKGKRLWRFSSGRKDAGYPKVLRGTTNWFRNVTAAFQWRDGYIYLFKGSQYSVWDESYRTPPRGYPRPISSFFTGVPNNIEAAIRYNRYTYFFKNKIYFKFDDWNRRVLNGYPKPKNASWMGCGRESH